MRFAGIDPGKKGGLALIDDHARVLELLPTPMRPMRGSDTREDYDVASIAELFRGWSNPTLADRGLFVVIERLHPLPAVFARKGGSQRAGGGVIANYNRGVAQGWGWLLAAFRIPHVFVLPRVWQRTLMAGWDEKADPKDRSIAFARRLWPDVSLRRTPRARTDDDGLAEALLLAEYGRREYLGGTVFAQAARA